ncbi:hypothetical protein G5B41_13870 [bacterium SGD-2]|jgi:hypothetical protein|nr:hypothetical protein [bacterium SGD-2]
MSALPDADEPSFHLVDTVISRESPNSSWITVEFVGEGGETVTVRLVSTVAFPTITGESSVIGRALDLMKAVVVTGGNTNTPLSSTHSLDLPEKL